MSLKNKVSSNLINIPGFRTKRKIVVIESDDWGFQRIPSLSAYNKISKKYTLDIFDKFDGLETDSDMLALFDTLSKFKDFKGNHPVLTAMTIMTNPDFQKMRTNNFENYEYEIFTDTLNKNPKSSNCFQLYLEGIRNEVFSSEYHGREHLNISMWLNAYKNNYRSLREFANYDSIPRIVDEDPRKYVTRTYNYANEFEKKMAISSIDDGIDIFNNTFSFKPKVFMAPAYCWSREIEEALQKKGIKYIQSGRVQVPPIYYSKKLKYVRHFIGEHNRLNQIYTIRNVKFEPTLENHKTDIINKAMEEIKTAFFWGKPAIIESHRVNYVSSKSENNSKKSLNLLSQLLKKIIQTYGDVEFLSSRDLFNNIDISSNI